MRVTILSASVNPSYYDLPMIAAMDFDGAVEFFKNDPKCCCSVRQYDVDLSKANEFKFCADGAAEGDGSDTMFVWTKVSNE